VVVIEHNLDVIKTADWIVDLGPAGGDRGGEIVAIGTPETVAAADHSATGSYLRAMLPAMRQPARTRPTPRPPAARRGRKPRPVAVAS